MFIGHGLKKRGKMLCSVCCTSPLRNGTNARVKESPLYKFLTCAEQFRKEVQERYSGLQCLFIDLHKHYNMTLWSRLFFLVRKAVTSATPCADPSGIHRAKTTGAEGNMRATTGVFLPCPRSLACTLTPVLPALCALQLSLMLLYKMHLISHSGLMIWMN